MKIWSGVTIGLACVTMVGAAVSMKAGGVEDRAQIYLGFFEKFLLEDPSDGVFGMNRLPSIHDNSNPDGVELRESFADLTIDHYPSAMTFGKFKDGVAQRMSTTSSHWQLDRISPDMVGLGIRASMDAERNLINGEVQSAASKLWKSGQKSSSFRTKYGNRSVVVGLRKVMPPRESCMKCHTDVPRGKAIGVAAVVLVQK